MEATPAFNTDATPLELWELIFSFFKDKLLANTVPLICRFARDLTHPNSKIWQEKCLAIDTSATNSERLTWKRCYYSAKFRLFPVMGHMIGEATIQQLRQSPGYCTQYSFNETVVINKVRFVVNNSGIFTRIGISRGGTKMPQPWRQFGFNWSTSWLQFKQVLKRWNGNYQVQTAPAPHKTSFMARITSVARHSATVYYLIDLCFIANKGTEDSSNTLDSITIRKAADLKSIYEAQMIVDTPLYGYATTSRKLMFPEFDPRNFSFND